MLQEHHDFQSGEEISKNPQAAPRQPVFNANNPLSAGFRTCRLMMRPTDRRFPVPDQEPVLD
jgi:hypothetical protein